MLGAGALSSLAAIRAGAGLVTLGIPKSLNLTAQKKISNVVMTFPLTETKEQTLSLSSLKQIKENIKKFTCLAIGPGLSTNKSTQKLILEIIENSKIPLVIDADALNAASLDKTVLKKSLCEKILTPHPGEMARLTRLSKTLIEKNRKKISLDFARKYKCVLLLKGNNTIVASKEGKTYINKTGNTGMAKAGSGDVLTGIIAAFIAQGLSAFDASKFGVYIHGKAGDIAAKQKTKTSMIATDIIDNIGQAIKVSRE